MSYCLNPTCSTPHNGDDVEVCQSCGASLRLQARYRAVKPIGQGGFGRTFLAVNDSQPLKPRCVIKQFFPQQQEPNQLEIASDLFRQEALRLQDLGKHPQIPDLLAYCEHEGHQYLIQEFIDGHTLAQELADAGTFTEAQIRQLLQDLLPVVQFIHAHQVIHRDIKPTNIIRRRHDRRLVLVDLGAAKYATGTALAKTGTLIGSAEYIAPEQARGKAVFASDLYSLGATCIHLLTDLSPFDLYDSGEGCWVWRSYVGQPVSAALSQILNQLLENATNRRYASAQAVLADLQTGPLSPDVAATQRSHQQQEPRSRYPRQQRQIEDDWQASFMDGRHPRSTPERMFAQPPSKSAILKLRLQREETIAAATPVGSLSQGERSRQRDLRKGKVVTLRRTLIVVLLEIVGALSIWHILQLRPLVQSTPLTPTRPSLDSNSRVWVNDSRVQVTTRVIRPTWVSVSVDAMSVYEGFLLPDTQSRWTGKTITVKASDAGSVMVVDVNGDSRQQMLGPRGELKAVTFASRHSH